jgi:hypothetical protein
MRLQAVDVDKTASASARTAQGGNCQTVLHVLLPGDCCSQAVEEEEKEKMEIGRTWVSWSRRTTVCADALAVEDTWC